MLRASAQRVQGLTLGQLGTRCFDQSVIGMKIPTVEKLRPQNSTPRSSCGTLGAT